MAVSYKTNNAYFGVIQIMNVFIGAMVRMLGFASLIGALHLSPHENILTIALINIYYLHNNST